jgi:two-component system sensor histidine kinase KdpD
MEQTVIKKIGIYAASIAVVGLTVAAFKSLFLGATPATVALVFVAEVLFIALLGGFGPSLVVALAASLCFNYFFLPPYGTFTIAHPADVVSFCVFLITAIVVSKLSSSVRKRAVEAEHRKDEVEHLLKFAKILIETPETLDGAASIADRIVEIFKVEYAGIYVPDQNGEWKHISVSSEELKGIALPQPGTLRSNTIAEMIDEYGKGVQYTTMITRSRTIGVIALRAPNLSKDTIAAIASLVALTVERNRLVCPPL